MPWWHENYIDPLNLYFHFTALAQFAKDLPLGTATMGAARNRASPSLPTRPASPRRAMPW